MTGTAPPDGDGKLRERLMVLETGLRHFQHICDMRHDQTQEAFARLDSRNDRQDSDLEVLEEKLLGKIEVIYTLLWSGMKWGGGLVAATLLTVLLKASNLL